MGLKCTGQVVALAHLPRLNDMTYQTSKLFFTDHSLRFETQRKGKFRPSKFDEAISVRRNKVLGWWVVRIFDNRL